MSFDPRREPVPLCEALPAVLDELERAALNPQPAPAPVVKLDLATMPYDDYLKTEWWQGQRAAAHKRAGYKCQLCGRRGLELHVHHNTYERRGRELPEDLVVLCADDHAKFHGKTPGSQQRRRAAVLPPAVATEWRLIVGDALAAYTRPSTLDGGQLVIIADSTAWGTQVRLLRPQLIQRLNDMIGEGTVTGITVKVVLKPRPRAARKRTRKQP